MPTHRPSLEQARSAFGTLPAVLAALSLLTAMVGGALVVASTYASDAEPARDSTPPDSYESIHDAGVTGENVSVGIIEPTGFDLDRLGERVVAARAFGNGKTLVNDGQNTHGTAVANTIGHIAPDADQYLAAFDDERDFRSAVSWMATQGVDVVVIPAAFYGKPGDGSARSTRAVQALARDTVVIAAAGNVGTRSWHGKVTPLKGDGGSDEIRVAPVELHVTSHRTQVWLSWTDPDAHYSLRLVQNNTTIATSNPYPADIVPNEVLEAQLRPGTYQLVITERRNVPSATVRIQSPTDDIHPPRPRGSLVAPATARGIVVVGAFDRSAGIVPAYSSRGPTLDGRMGVDLVAPANPLFGPRTSTNAGTSYAAARTAGVAALMLSTAPDRSPHVIEAALERSAWDIGPAGRDMASGAGLLRPGHAVAEIRTGR